MRLSADDLRALARVIERIDDGKAPPRVGGPVGLFFRQYARFRREVAHVLARAGVATAADGHIQGADLGSIEMTPLSSVYTAIPNDLWGPVAHVPMVCEELVHVIDLTLWLNARAANEVDRLLSVDQVGAVRLAGSYRWHAPHRVTPGEASPEPAQTEVRWHDARCLKATADDLASPPHPLEYTIDFRLGPPGVKTFRSFVARYVPERTRVDVLPGRGARTLPIALELPRGSLRELRGGGLVMVLGFREPWDGDWTVVAADAVDKTTALAHALTWADFRLEVEGSPPLADADTLELTAALRAAGVAVSSVGAALDRATLVRCGLPAALAVARWLRART